MKAQTFPDFVSAQVRPPYPLDNQANIGQTNAIAFEFFGSEQLLEHPNNRFSVLHAEAGAIVLNREADFILCPDGLSRQAIHRDCSVGEAKASGRVSLEWVSARFRPWV
ncbi:MAG: hypothetical protein ABI273_22020 [Lacunisphaera sp.]